MIKIKHFGCFVASSTIVITVMACGSSESTSPVPTQPSSITEAGSSMMSSWTQEGLRLDNSLAGYSGVLADTSTIQLDDGTWRMYMHTGGQIRSATSINGLTFTMESGGRLPEGYGQPRAIKLSDGRVRIFANTGDGIGSGVSEDGGLTFSAEGGVRVSASSFGVTQLTGPSNIVRTSDGRWRMYFSDLPLPGEGPIPHSIHSASSSDLYSWSPDFGARIGPLATLTGSGEHPAAIANGDGSISLFYFRNDTFQLMVATSVDGLEFTAESDTGLSSNVSMANDPDLVRLPGGAVRMYYNEGTEAGGRIYSALHPGVLPW